MMLGNASRWVVAGVLAIFFVYIAVMAMSNHKKPMLVSDGQNGYMVPVSSVAHCLLNMFMVLTAVGVLLLYGAPFLLGAGLSSHQM